MKSFRIRELSVSLFFAIVAVIVLSSDPSYGQHPGAPLPADRKCSQWPLDQYKDAPDGIHPGVKGPSYFYQQCVQPIWNNKCLGCHSVPSTWTGQPQTTLSLAWSGSFHELIWERSPAFERRVVPGDISGNAGTLMKLIKSKAPGNLDCSNSSPSNPPTTCLWSNEIFLIERWIENGAY